MLFYHPHSKVPARPCFQSCLFMGGRPHPPIHAWSEFGTPLLAPSIKIASHSPCPYSCPLSAPMGGGPYHLVSCYDKQYMWLGSYWKTFLFWKLKVSWMLNLDLCHLWQAMCSSCATSSTNPPRLPPTPPAQPPFTPSHPINSVQVSNVEHCKGIW